MEYGAAISRVAATYSDGDTLARVQP
jgi:hypothetical protein